MSEGFKLTRETLATIRARITVGDEDWEIAGRIGCDLNTLHGLCKLHGYALRDGREREPRAIVGLDHRTRNVFAKEAGRRGMSAQQLMSNCLELIAKDKLFDAVVGAEVKPCR
jgi:hypothetical protein